jgi:DNA-directed RNA polymerase subunit K/omega
MSTPGVSPQASELAEPESDDLSYTDEQLTHAVQSIRKSTQRIEVTCKETNLRLDKIATTLEENQKRMDALVEKLDTNFADIHASQARSKDLLDKAFSLLDKQESVDKKQQEAIEETASRLTATEARTMGLKGLAWCVGIALYEALRQLHGASLPAPPPQLTMPPALVAPREVPEPARTTLPPLP